MEAPAPYKTAAMCNMVAGGLTILVGLAYLMFCVGIIMIPVGIWQVMVGMKMNEGQKDPNAKNSLIAGAVVGLLSFNLISLAASGFGYMQLGQDEVVAWLEG